jgi:hypothetical protein
MTVRWEEKRAQYILKMDKGPCLIPKPGRLAPSCHEYDYCECEMCDAWQNGYSEGIGSLAEKLLIAEEALTLIAAPKRPDGTYNRDREACEQLAKDALLKIRGDG